MGATPLPGYRETFLLDVSGQAAELQLGGNFPARKRAANITHPLSLNGQSMRIDPFTGFAARSSVNCEPKRGLTIRQEAAIRLGEIARLHHWRTKYGVEIDQNKWLFVICHTLAPLKEREGGLDLFHVNEFLRRHRMPLRDDDAKVKTIHNVCDYRKALPQLRNLSRTTATKMLDVTADERWRNTIKTMDAVDETPEQRKSLRLQTDRERKERERRAKGVKTRQEYEATSLSSTKPWLELGIGRRTWERRRAKAADSVPVQTMSGQVPIRQSALQRDDSPVRQSDQNGNVVAFDASVSAPIQKEICLGQTCDTDGNLVKTYRMAA
jgi:hypothetical protein